VFVTPSPLPSYYKYPPSIFIFVRLGFKTDLENLESGAAYITGKMRFIFLRVEHSF
jgi:hypothetical protein